MSARKVESDKVLDILHSHYQETFSDLTSHVKRRDRVFLYVLIIISLILIQTLFPKESETLIAEYIKTSTGTSGVVQTGLVSSALLFGLLVFVLRYFQTHIFIERRYIYIKSLEEKIAGFLGGGIYSREGGDYGKDYPAFSMWMHIVYTMLFPILLVVVSTYSIWNTSWDLMSFKGLFDTGIYLALIVSIGIYLHGLHWGKLVAWCKPKIKKK